jgi:hypothetical protein
MKNSVFAICGLAAALLSADGAVAAPVTPDPPLYLIELGENALPGVIARDPGSYASSGGRATGSVFGTPAPLVTAQATSVAGDFLTPGSTTSAASRLYYSYAVNGPVDGVLVPLFVSTRLHAEASGPGEINTRAAASLTIGGSTLDVAAILNTDFNSPLPGPEFFGTLSFNQLSGRVGQIALQAVVSAAAGGSAMAFADPFLFIDPVFLAANPGFAVSVSAGIVNAVPAPPALVLLGTSLIALLAGRKAGSQPATSINKTVPSLID